MCSPHPHQTISATPAPPCTCGGGRQTNQIKSATPSSNTARPQFHGPHEEGGDIGHGGSGFSPGRLPGNARSRAVHVRTSRARKNWHTCHFSRQSRLSCDARGLARPPAPPTGRHGIHTTVYTGLSRRPRPHPLRHTHRHLLRGTSLWAQ